MKSLYHRQIERGFKSLRFEPALEKEYLEDVGCAGLSQLRLALMIGSLYQLSFPTMDYFFDGPGFSDPSIPMRTAITQPLIILMFAFTYMARFRSLLTYAGVAVGMSIGLTTLFMESAGGTFGIASDLAGYLLSTFYIFFYLGLRFWPAVATSVALYAMFIAVGVVGPTPGNALIFSGVMLTFANVIGVTGLYNLEYSKRLSFLEEGELRFMADQDALTMIANRGAFDRHFDRTWRHCQREQIPLALALVDIDHFKQYNDHYGHQAGDDCLVNIAPIIETAAKRPLDLAARYGGEEFVVLLPGCNTAQAARIIEDVRKEVVRHMFEHVASPTSKMVTISAGVSSVVPPGDGPEELLRVADEALYKAKSEGRNRVGVSEESMGDTQLAQVIELSLQREQNA
ncbi:MAG: diguanylate cyclase [Woeseiaceae bacterium]|nr:diguanylate cyclase [Woeseiaceae bacterium]